MRAAELLCSSAVRPEPVTAREVSEMFQALRRAGRRTAPVTGQVRPDNPAESFSRRLRLAGILLARGIELDRVARVTEVPVAMLLLMREHSAATQFSTSGAGGEERS